MDRWAGAGQAGAGQGHTIPIPFYTYSNANTHTHTHTHTIPNSSCLMQVITLVDNKQFIVKVITFC